MFFAYLLYTEVNLMHTVAIITNKKKDTDSYVTNKCIELLKDKFNLVFSDGTDPESLKTLLKDCFSAIVIGGDGTILLAASALAEAGVPILGINMGHMGFLADVELSELEKALCDFADGNYNIEERFMIEAMVNADKKEKTSPLTALNDLVISRASYTRMIALDVLVDNHFVTSYVGDGVVVSTPTGSTAYSLSAGGPVVDSSLDVCIITPVCPHTMSSKPLIVPGSSEITIKFHANFDDISMLTADGQKSVKIAEGDEIVIKASPLKTRLIKVSGRGFYDIFTKKLQG